MNQFMKRSIAVLIALVLVISLVPSSVFTASAAGYTYNWGIRGELATFLSDMAQAWYAKYNVSYESLSALSGSSSTSSVPSSALYTKLKSLMTNAHSFINNYDKNKETAQYTDCQNGGGAISSFYSGKSIGPTWDGSWNREHTWPNSKGLGGSDENDVMMIRPTSEQENSSRGNTAYGQSSGYYNPNSASNGKYDLRGDVARIMLYVYVRWGNTTYMWGKSGVMESREVLLQWMEEDPVDTWELGRNDSVQSITGTRNVFVDYPELAFIMFGENVPAGYDSPSGSGLASAYTITAQSNNTSYGTVSLSGKTITAYPKEGYLVSGYEVLSGTATVTQSGNVFTVSASSDCTVQVNFVPKTLVTVNFSGANVAAQTGYAGETMSLPTAEAPNGYTFLGWMDAPLNEATTEKPSFYTDSFVPTGNTTLYALYQYVDTTTGEGGSGDYVKVTTAPADWSGEYLIVYEAGSAIFDGSQSASSLDSASNKTTVTITGNTIAAADGDSHKLIIAAMENGYSIQTVSGNYIGGQSGSNKVVTSSSPLLNTIALDGSYNAVITSNSQILRYNSSAKMFRYYKSGQLPITLYRKDGSSGTVYYVSTLCDHASTSEVAAVAATCTENGYTAGVFCNDCKTYISGHEVVEATGHSMDGGTITTAPTCTGDGVKTYTCTACGATETEAVPATGHSMDEGKITTAPTCTEDGVKTYTCTVCGATETEVVPATGHSMDEGKITTDPTCTEDGVKTFTCTVCGVTQTEAVPATGHNYVADGDTYTCINCGESYTKSANRYYIATKRASGNYFYMTNDLGTASTKRYQAVDSGLTTLPDTITAPEDDKVFVLVENGDGTYSIYADGVTSNNYLGHSGTSNSGLLVAEENALKLTVDVTDGIYNIHYARTSTEERYLSLNSTAGNDYFAWYKTGQSKDLVLIPVVEETTEETELVAQWNVALEDNLNVNFHLNLNAEDQVKVTVGIEETVYNASALEQTADGKYIVTVEMAAAQMMDEIAIQVVDSGADPEIYTIRQYADTVLADDTKSNYHALVKEMLNYGAMAQVYFDYNASNLANAGIEGFGTAEVTEATYEPTVYEGAVEGIRFYSTTLSYRDKIALRFYFETTDDAIGSYTFTANGASCTPVKKGEYYYIEVAGITPDNLDQQIEVTVTGTNSQSLTIRYSPMNYIVRMNAKGGENLQALLKALYNYHLAAKALKNA